MTATACSPTPLAPVAPHPRTRRYVDGAWVSNDGSAWPLTSGFDAATLTELARAITTLPAELADCELLEQLDIYDNPFESLPEELEEDGALEENGCNIVREAIN